MTIEEGNKLIAEFCSKPYDKNHLWFKGKEGILKYHTSWDWLMPVVNKIRNDHFVNIEMYGDFVCTWITKDKDVPNGIIYSEHAKPIMSVYGAVIQFINWHNENKTT